MHTLKELYKIGNGPSSSHTMGPEKASRIVKEKYPEADYFKVFLYGSLAFTGKGHLTDYIIKKTLEPVETEVVFNYIDEVLHPNTMDFIAYLNHQVIGEERVFSIGGGAIQFRDEPIQATASIYPHKTFDEIKQYCNEKNYRLPDYVEEVEGKDIWEFLHTIWDQMKASIEEGLHTEGVIPGELKVKRRAPGLSASMMKKEPSPITENRLVSAYAFAVNEVNASGGKVVTAPTCGASGTVPAVLKYMQERHHFTDDQVVRALATAGIIGNLIKHNASISGAEAGCQAEVGSACAMAAAAHAELFTLNIDQIEYAAEIALEHHLGLTCDPVLGYVQIPCIERNAVAALRAIDACGLAFFLYDSRKISLDVVIDTMYQTGKDMHSDYRETSAGGLAKKYKSS